jgi:hypothetical protein
MVSNSGPSSNKTRGFGRRNSTGTLEIGDRARLSPEMLNAVMAGNDSAILVIKKDIENKNGNPFTIS